MTEKELKEEFQKESGIDLTDFECVGIFPKYFKKQNKWGSTPRGTAYKQYAEFLENKLKAKS